MTVRIFLKIYFLYRLDISDSIVIFGGMTDEQFISGYPKYMKCEDSKVLQMVEDEKMDQLRKTEERRLRASMPDK